MAALRDRSDEAAFAVLYDRHTPAMYRLALRQTGGDTAAAEDIVHEAWIRGVDRLSAFLGTSALRSWLCGIVVRVAWEMLRTRVQDAEVGEIESEDARLSGVVDRIDLERAIASLPPGFRQILVLHDVQGMTHDEIARLLEIAPGTSKSQLARARALLRNALGQGARHA